MIAIENNTIKRYVIDAGLLRAARGARPLSEIARAAGCKPQRLLHYETGKCQPRDEFVPRLIRALGIHSITEIARPVDWID
jgi:transcriptional regulator with XRE-family HTH domain